MNTKTSLFTPAHYPWHARFMFALLEQIKLGQLHLITPDGENLHFEGQSHPLAASIHIHDWAVFKECINKGAMGFAESYIKGYWDSNDILSLLRLFLVNRSSLEKVLYGTWLGQVGYRVKHWLNRNSKSGSLRNIHAHYDLGNDFYGLWLDSSMTYSSAIYTEDHQSLEQAQLNKYNRILDALELSPQDKLLEVGCGWGGFMEQAHRRSYSIDCLTISKEQATYAEQRAAQVKQNDADIQIKLADYRDHHQLYDGIASIEMFEAVGEEYWPDYFDMLHRCLKPGKKACIQTIVIADELFDRYRRRSDFIQQYVFPGGMLPSLSRFKKLAVDHQFEVVDVFAFGQDYKKTLCAWHQEFNQHLTEVKQLGFDHRFIRLWNMYLMYCAAGFAEGSTDVVQVTLKKI